jgi:hypothetical protein
MNRTVVLVALACLLLAVAAYAVLFGEGALRLANPARLAAAAAVGVVCGATALVALRR